MRSPSASSVPDLRRVCVSRGASREARPSRLHRGWPLPGHPVRAIHTSRHAVRVMLCDWVVGFVGLTHSQRAHTTVRRPEVKTMLGGPWQRFQALAGHKRVLLGIGGMVLSSLGLYFSEKMERQDPPHEIAIEGAKSLGLVKRGS